MFILEGLSSLQAKLTNLENLNIQAAELNKNFKDSKNPAHNL